MSVYISKKDLKNITEKLSISFGCVENYDIVQLSDLAGFWGDHYILKIYSGKFECFEFFLKAYPRHNEKRMEIIQETGFFEREMKFYKLFIPKLVRLSSISWAPEIYLAKPNHFIVLENLKDYKLCPSKINVWDYQHFEIAIKTLAIFHASTVIYEEKFGKFTNDELSLLEEVAYPQKEGHVRYTGVENGIKTLIKLTKLIPKYKNSLKLEEVLKIFPETIRKIFTYVKPSAKYKNILLHGDIWTNNVMFKYDENNVPIGCKYIDFQFARFAPPAMDLATLFFASSTPDFRKSHMDDLLDIYCNTIENELDRYGISHSKLPRSEIFQSFNEYKIIGMIESVLFNHVTMLPSDVAVGMMNSTEEYEKFFRESREGMCLKAFIQEKYYRDRITEILSELIDDFIIPILKF